MTNKEAIYIINNRLNTYYCTDEDLQALDLAVKALEERPQGEWIYTDKEDKKKGYGGYCSVCKCDMPIGMIDWKLEYYESKFCPNCGAYMKGGTK